MTVPWYNKHSPSTAYSRPKTPGTEYANLSHQMTISWNWGIEWLSPENQQSHSGTNGGSVRVCSVTSVWLSVTPWTVAHQAPLSMGFSRQEYWSGLPCPPPGDLPDSGIEPESLMSPALAGRFFTTSATWEAHNTHNRPQIQSWYSLPPLPSPLAKCRIQGTFSEHNIIKWKQLFL